MKKALTLVELMIVVAILGLLASYGATFILTNTKFFRESSAKGEVQREARTVMEIITRRLRQASASSIVISNKPGQPPYSYIRFTSEDGIRREEIYQEGKRLYMVALVNNTTTFLKIAENLRQAIFTLEDTSIGNLITLSLCFEKETVEGKVKLLHLSIDKVKLYNE
ncbi:MAG: type II secretion system GspH family protein [bacterium]|nr:type II secretion system GspH family protein [bacterium]